MHMVAMREKKELGVGVKVRFLRCRIRRNLPNSYEKGGGKVKEVRQD